MNFTEENWNECLKSLGFTEEKNLSFGGMVVCNDKGTPCWTYDNEEEKKQLYIFLSGAIYWKIHTRYS